MRQGATGARVFSTPIERVLARVCREAGARVRFNAFLRDMNIGVGANDGRRIEVLAQDLPCFGRAQLAVDATLRCALARTGEPHPRAADEDGAVLAQARHDKETRNPELINSRRCRLIVVAIETGSGGIHQTARLRESSRSAFVHVVADNLGVATPLDQDALHRVLPVVRGFPGGTFGQLHHVVPDRW